MKITFVLPYAGLSGGIRVIAIYADRLQKRGHEVFVVSTPRKPLKFKEKLKSLLHGKGWSADNRSTASHFDGLDIPHKVIPGGRSIEETDIPDADIVIATWWRTAERVANLPKSKGAKVYFIQHHETHDYLPKDKVEATYSLSMHKIVISQWLVTLMRERYGDTRVSLVPNSVDTKQFYAPPRNKQPIPTVGMMYKPVPWKGCDVSLQAFSIAAQTLPNLRLITFGIAKPVPSLKLPPNAEFIYRPPQDTIKDLYAKCDAWLFGSRLEGFGLPILESMACRTPVIGTPAGAAPELLADGCGILVQPEAPEDMAKAIIRVFHMSDSEWRAMSDAAYTKATSYTWDDATDLLEAALQTAIERDRRGELSS